MKKLVGMRGLCALGVVCLALGAALPAAGSTFLAMDHEELLVHSDSVVEGQVLRVVSSWDATGRVIVSEAEILIDETVAGQGMGGIITVQTFGGQVGDYHVEAAGFPRFEEGEWVVLFLNQREALDGMTRVTGYQLGHYRIFDREGTPMAAPAVDGEARFLRDGRPVEPPQALPLAELKSQLRRIEARILNLAP